MSLQNKINTSCLCGIFYGMPFMDYWERIEYINASMITQGLKSMRHMDLAVNTILDNNDTPAKRWGRLMHRAILEPRFLDNVTVLGPKERLTAAMKEKDHDGGVYLRVQEYQALRCARKMMMASHCAPIIDSIESDEVSLFWETDSIKCKGRIDGVDSNLRIIEYKSTRPGDFAPRQFARAAFNYGYHIKAGWLALGMKKLRNLPDLPAVTFVVQENQPPFDCYFRILGGENLAMAADEALAIAENYIDCKKDGRFPGISEELDEPYQFPAYSSYHDANDWSPE